jgi:hypothetical protein
MRRTSSNTTISSMSTNQVYTDRDLSSVSHTASKKTKFGKLFNVSTSKQSSLNNSKLHSENSSGSILSTTSKSALANSTKNHNNSNASLNNTHEVASPSTPSLVVPGQRRNTRNQLDQNLNVNNRTPPQIFIKPDRRKDFKLTNCQEKDGIWTATGQFGRESRRSKRAEISYDKKKFKFMQKDEQGNKHVFEIPVADVEGKI